MAEVYSPPLETGLVAAPIIGIASFTSVIHIGRFPFINYILFVKTIFLIGIANKMILHKRYIISRIKGKSHSWYGA